MAAARRLVILLCLATLLGGAVAQAGPLPSVAEAPPDAGTDGARAGDLEVVHDFLARDDVRRVLADRGLGDGEIDSRLASLSDADLRYLADNLSQVQAAGEVPEYIWWLLAGLLGVLILAAIF